MQLWSGQGELHPTAWDTSPPALVPFPTGSVPGVSTYWGPDEGVSTYWGPVVVKQLSTYLGASV